MRRLLGTILLLLSSVCLSGQDSLPAADTSGPQDLKIGLVLSGGGAKCLAQLGALEVMEEAGLHFDYIGGTSMGAIIGAMYALGYPLSEIERYLKSIHWPDLLSNEIPHHRLTHLDRPKARRYVATLPIKEGKPQLPQGLNQAQNMLTELSYIAQQSYHYSDFSQFPTPFLCVATNLETGQARILEDGSLVKALRASASFPSLFVPYPIDDTLYVDGGVINNYPVVPVQKKNMDRIIGIDVQDYLYQRAELQTVIHILEQTSSFINGRQKQLQQRYTDILVEPSLPETGITDFQNIDRIIQTGRDAARRNWDALRQLARQDSSLPQKRPSHKPQSEILLTDLALHGTQESSERYIRGKLKLDTGLSYTKQDLSRSLDILYGTHYFKTIHYQLEPLRKGYRLHIFLQEKEELNTISLGINYNTDFQTAILANYTHRDLFFDHDQFNADLALGESPRIQAQYFLDRGYIPTLGLKFRSDQFKFNTFSSTGSNSELRYQDYSLSLFAQSTIANSYALGGGVQLENSEINALFGNSELDDFNSGFINYYGFIDFNSLDHPYFPRQGFSLQASYRIIARRQGFSSFLEPSSVLDAEYRETLPLHPRLTLLTRLGGAITIGPKPPIPYRVYLGSQGRDYVNYIYSFAGYRYMELSGRNLLLAGAELQYEFLDQHYLRGKFNMGQLRSEPAELLSLSDPLHGYSLGYSYRSPLGPLSLHIASRAGQEKFYTYLSMGMWF